MTATINFTERGRATILGGPVHLETPFSVRLDGRWYDGATNGQAFAIARVETPSYERPDAPAVTADLARLSARATHTLDRVTFLEHASEDADTPCPCCLGSGKHRCECAHCPYDGPCEECSGEAWILNRQYVEVGAVRFDATLVWRYLRSIETDAPALRVSFGATLEPIAIWDSAGDFRVVVMPVRAGESDRLDDDLARLFVPIAAEVA